MPKNIKNQQLAYRACTEPTPAGPIVPSAYYGCLCPPEYKVGEELARVLGARVEDIDVNPATRHFYAQHVIGWVRNTKQQESKQEPKEEPKEGLNNR